MSTRKIIVTRPYGGSAVARAVREDAARAAAASRGRRQASYALHRLIGTMPGTGRPLLATGRGVVGVGEVKFFDVDISDSAALPVVTAVAGAEPAAGFTGLTEINCVAQGATSYNRIGSKIQVKSIQLKVGYRLIGSAPVSTLVRFLVVYDRQPNGAFPAIGDILSDNISTAPSFHSGINMANKDRFIIIRDQYRPLCVAGGNVAVVSEFIKLRQDTQFKSNTSTIGDITSGALYYIACTQDVGSGTSAAQQVFAHTRIRYFD